MSDLIEDAKGWGKCKTCLYRNTVEYNRVNNCDYILITGHKRPSPGGLECTVYERDTRKGAKKR